MDPSDSLVLFDIDGTLLRRSGPHHRQALVDAIRARTGLSTTTDDVPVAGMLDREILAQMLRNAGVKDKEIRAVMPELVRAAQRIYGACETDLRRKVCPGVRSFLRKLQRAEIPVGLVTGNLTRIAWRKMERAGLRPYFRFGAFAEMGKTRAELIRIAIAEARRRKWIRKTSGVTMIGDHANDVLAARANGVRSIAVATGVLSAEELRAHAPDLVLADMRSLTLEMLACR